MNSKNKILVGCLTLLLVLSVGYAYFSDTITINGTATAKGEFSLTTTEVDLTESWVTEYGFVDSDVVSKGIVENPTINVSGNLVTTSVTLGMPGSWQYFGIKITNTGSIPAKLVSIIDKTNNVPIIDKNIETGSSYGNDVYMIYADENNQRKNYMLAQLTTDSGWWDFDDFTSDITAGERWREESNFVGEMLDATLDSGEEVYFFIKYEWSSGSTTSGDPLELNWQLEFNWQQVAA